MSDDTIMFAAAAANDAIFIYDSNGLYGRTDQLRVYRLAEVDGFAVQVAILPLHISSVPAVLNGNHHLLVQHSSDQQLWHYRPTSSEPLPKGTFGSSPSMCSWGGDRLDVFVLGAGNLQLSHSYQDKKEGKWERWLGDVPQLPNGLKSAPVAASWGPGRIDIVARGADDAVWHVCFDLASKGWQPWRSLGGTVTAAPTICALKPHRLDVFARGLDYRLWHKYWDGGQWRSPKNAAINDWADEAGAPEGGVPVGGGQVTPNQLFSAPVAVIKNGEIYVLAVGPGAAVWHTRWTGSKWSKWIPTKTNKVPA